MKDVEALFGTAAELVLRLPSVVPVHAQTSANALHYVFRESKSEETQQLAMLQSAENRKLTGLSCVADGAVLKRPMAPTVFWFGVCGLARTVA